MLGARLQTTTAAAAAAAVQVRRGRPFLSGRGRAADEPMPSTVQRIQAGSPAELALQQQQQQQQVTEWIFIIIHLYHFIISRPRANALRVFSCAVRAALDRVGAPRLCCCDNVSFCAPSPPPRHDLPVRRRAF